MENKNRFKKSNTTLKCGLFTAAFAVIFYYFYLPPVNIKSARCMSYLFIVSLVFTILYYFSGGNAPVRIQGNTISFDPQAKAKSKIPGMITAGLFILPVVITFIFSSTIFHARAYSRILTVTEGTVADIPSVEKTASIALMDTASAEKLGNREIGSLSRVVSQYNVSGYTQIDYQGTPVKTSPLRYDGIIKWWKNRKNGVPGYVLVDPVRMDADYTELPKGMIYVPSAYFNENLERHIRFHFPTVMFDDVHFEIDEEGNPWYVASVYDHLVGLYGGDQVVGAILVDPVTGACEKKAVGDIPRWVDVVFPGDLICAQYNNAAQLHSGFINSVIGQSGCRKITEYESDDEYTSDYGYISKDGDIWIYTGVTSLNNDSSNIGFILSNERTEETIFITCSGADEFSAMASAQGEVQEKRYAASFPSLILLDEVPTYIMVLKDASGLVKMYACVNVEQYNMVATATTQADCIAKYKALVAGRISQAEATAEGTVVDVPEETDTSSWETRTVTIAKMREIVRDGNTYLYIVDENENIYSARYTDVIDMILVEEGDTVTILTDGERFVMK